MKDELGIDDDETLIIKSFTTKSLAEKYIKYNWVTNDLYIAVSDLVTKVDDVDYNSKMVYASVNPGYLRINNYWIAEDEAATPILSGTGDIIVSCFYRVDKEKCKLNLIKRADRFRKVISNK